MKWIKRLIKGSLALVIFILLVWLALALFVQSDKGQKWMMTRLIQFVEQETDTTVKINRIEFLLPLRLRVHDLLVEKEGSPLFSAESLDLSCLSPKLLHGEIDCSYIYAKGLSLANHPLLKKQSGSSQFNVPKLPFFHIGKFLFEDIQIAPELLKNWIPDEKIENFLQSYLFTIHGSMKINFHSTNLHFNLSSHSPTKKPFELQINLKNDLVEISFSGEKIEYDQHVFELKTAATGPLLSWIDLLAGKNLNAPITGSLWVTNLDSTSDKLMNELVNSIQTNFAILSLEKVNLTNIQAKSNAGFLTGLMSYQLTSNHLDGTFEGHIDTKFIEKNVTFLHSHAEKISVKGSLSGPLNNPKINLNLLVPTVTIQNEMFDEVELNIDSKMTDKNFLGGCNLTCSYKNRPLALSTQYILENSLLQLNDLKGATQDSTLNGTLSLSLTNYLVEGNLHLLANNISPLSSLFLTTPIRGNAEIKLTFIKQENQLLNAHIMASDLEIENNTIKSLIVDSTIDQLGSSSPQITSTISVENITTPTLEAKNLNIQASHHLSISTLKLTQINATVTGGGITYNDMHAESGTFYLKADDTDIDHISFNLKNLSNPKMKWQELSGESEVKLDSTPCAYTISGKGQLHHSLTFTTNGFWSHEQTINTGINVKVDRLSGKYGPYLFGARTPFKINYLALNQEMAVQDEKGIQELFEVIGLNLFLGEGDFKADCRIEKNLLNGYLEGIDIPAELFHFAFPEAPLSGSFSFMSHLNGSVEKPVGKVVVSLHQAKIIEDIFLSKPFMDGQIEIDLHENAIGFQGFLNGIGKSPLLIKGKVPSTFSLIPFTFSLDKKSPFELSLDADGDLEPYFHLFLNDSYHLTGQALIALKMNGTLETPEIVGHIEVIDGSYESYSTGAIYNNISAELEANNSKIILKNLIAKDSRHGEIAASGTLWLDSLNHFPYDFEIHPQQIYLIDSDYMTITASGHLNLVGDNNKRLLKGSLRVDETAIRMEQALPAQIKTVDVTYVNLKDEEDPSQHRHKTSWPIELDIQADLPQNVIITSKSLDSEWKGSLDITGTHLNPQLWGELRVISGDYNLQGKKFALTQGNIHFAGPIGKKTTLYAVLAKEIGKIKAEIIVKGPTNKLKFSFKSNPPLSQREVLSYILFGRGVSDITSNQGEALAQSFIELSTEQSSQTDLLTRLKNIIGLDQLDFTSSEQANTGDVSVQVGKYLSDDVKVSVNRSINTASNRVAIEAKLHKNWQAQGEMGDDAQGKVILKWKKDY